MINGSAIRRGHSPLAPFAAAMAAGKKKARWRGLRVHQAKRLLRLQARRRRRMIVGIGLGKALLH